VFTASFAAAAGIGIVSVNWQVGLAVNSQGSVMLFGQAGPSVGAGLAVGGQVGAQRGSLNDLLAPTGEGGGGSITVAAGPRPSVTVTGNEVEGLTGIAVGGRGGVGAFGNLTNGGLGSDAVSIPEKISSFKAAVGEFINQGIAAMRCASGYCR
jgi:hypothetical protein